MIGVASLSLAACGGGETTVQTQQPKTEPVPPMRDCTAVPLPAGCPDPEPTPPAVPLPLDGLGDGYLPGASIAIKEVADSRKVQLNGPSEAAHPNASRLAIQGLQLRRPTDTLMVSAGGVLRAVRATDFVDTKIPKVKASKNGSNIAYSFGLYTPAAAKSGTTFTTGLAQLQTNTFEQKIFSLDNNNAYTSVRKFSSIASQFGTGWDYSSLKASVPSVKDGAKDATLYAELWTDRGSASVTDTNYMTGGWWLLAPNNPSGDYRFGIFAKAENYYPRPGIGAVKPAVMGEATYKGTAAGLHLSSEDGIVSMQRLLGKVTLTADFGTTTERGTIEGKIDKLTLDGKNVTGEVLLPSVTLPPHWYIHPVTPSNTDINTTKSNIGNIKGQNYRGDWAGTFQGDASGNDQPTGVVGVVGGSGGGNSFVASFGAKKVGAE